MNKTIIGWGAGLGLLAVILGALGAHALRGDLDASTLESFRTAVDYQMYHALFLLLLGSTKMLEGRDRKQVFYLILGGVLCFSFSIYALTTGPLAGLDFTPIAWVTPLGGLLLITGWGLLLYRVIRGLNRVMPGGGR
jgi:uncharacterized membrane protein YgdD (TMEM256/DUF423 family)